MTERSATHVLLIDANDEAGRTTANLVGSLASRLLTLHYTSGVSVVGSMVAGLAAIGREVSRTSEGARMRQALEAGTAGHNGEALWSALRIGEMATGLPPSPLLDHVRNDLALLLADDLDRALLQPQPPPAITSRSEAGEVETVRSIDCLLGLWAYSQEIVRAVEALAQPELPPAGAVIRKSGSAGVPEGEEGDALLR